MPDALDTLRRHEDLKEEERAALDFQSIVGDTTRTLVASLLTAILCERVEGYHGQPGEWYEAGQQLMEATLTSAQRAQLIDYTKAQQVQRRYRSTYNPSDLLIKWGDTREWLEEKRKDRAMQSLQKRESAIAA